MKDLLLMYVKEYEIASDSITIIYTNAEQLFDVVRANTTPCEVLYFILLQFISFYI